MERYEQPCAGRMRIFITWGLYALAVAVLSRYIAERGLPGRRGVGRRAGPRARAPGLRSEI